MFNVWRLRVISFFFQFFKTQTYRDAPGPALSWNCDGTLSDLLVFVQSRVPKPMFYEQLPFSIYELEYKRPVKCIYNDSEITLYPNKDGTVADLVIML
jgi:ubiquitin carboxyl-terminal hydrolase 7